MDRVVFQQMRHSIRFHHIVNGNYPKILLPVCHPEKHSSDPSETVDCYSDLLHADYFLNFDERRF
jgi:hypothetical protein